MLEILADHDLAPNQVVASRYRLERIIGEGGMGVVWAAVHVLTGKPCALKFIKASRAADPKSHERLLHEARAACKVRHPNVAQVHDILELESGVPFIVMDLLEGEPLSMRIARRGRFELGEAAPLLLQIVDAISAAHALAIVHRDLKPDNVFLERGLRGRDVVRILDFGIAKHLEVVDAVSAELRANATTLGLTTTHSMIGTPLYMAPEQLRRSHVVDRRADIWGLGVVAFECLLGERPERDEATGGVTPGAFARLAAREPRVPADLRDLLSRLLATECDARPTLEETHRVLSLYVRERVDASETADGAMSATVAPPARPRPAKLAWAGGAFVVIALLVANIAFVRAPEPVDTAVRPSASPTVPVGEVGLDRHIEPAPSSTSSTASPATLPSGAAAPPAAPAVRRSRTKATTAPSVSAVAPPVAAQSAAVPAPRDAIPSFERE